MVICDHNLDKEVFIVAEIGNNHEGDFKKALDLVDAASYTGVNAVKFQTFIPEKFYASSETSRIEKLNKFKLSKDDFKKISDFARSKGLIFFSTPLDLESAQFLNNIQRLFKISSGDNTFWPLIKKVSSFNKPTIISTGASGFCELDRIYSYYEANNQLKNLSFLHCVSSYPVPKNQANLLMIQKLLNKYKNINIGYSDHTLGIEAASCAVALGAKIIEKHFTLDKNFSDFRDHQLSAEPDEMKLLVKRVRDIQEFMNPYQSEIQPCEEENLKLIKRSIAASKNICQGEQISLEDIMYVRPGFGFQEKMEKKIVGRKTSKFISKGELFSEENIVFI